mgnify:CR=1 FL=1
MNTLFREQRLGRIIADLSALIYSDLQPVALDAAPGFYASPSEADGAVFAPFGVQETWGGRNSYTWFRGLTAAPVCGQDECPVLLVDTVDAEVVVNGANAILCHGDGKPLGLDESAVYAVS